MKNKSQIKQNIVNKRQIKTHSFNEVFGKDLKSREFKNVYSQEIFRLRLARQIREIRTEKNLTQKDVAQKAKMTQSVVARIESGKHSISLETLDRIAQVLNKKIQLT